MVLGVGRTSLWAGQGASAEGIWTVPRLGSQDPSTCHRKCQSCGGTEMDPRVSSQGQSLCVSAPCMLKWRVTVKIGRPSES